MNKLRALIAQAKSVAFHTARTFPVDMIRDAEAELNDIEERFFPTPESEPVPPEVEAWMGDWPMKGEDRDRT